MSSKARTKAKTPATKPQPKSARRTRLMPIVLGVGALAAAAAYVGVAVHGKDTLPSGTTVAGHHIGGMTRAQAATALRSVSHPQAQQTATIAAGGESFGVKPGTSYRLDTGETLGSRVGFSLNPVVVWQHAFGGGDVQPHFTLDRKDLQQKIGDAAQRGITGAPKQGRVLFVGGEVRRVDGAPGKGIDVAAMTRKIADGWPERLEYRTSLITVQPDATAKALDTFARTDARTAMSQPLRLRGGGHSMTLQPKEVSDVISTKIVDGTPRIAVDGAALEKLVLSRSSDFISAPQDAKVVWTDGTASVSSSKDGTTLDSVQLASATEKALVGDHVATVRTVTDPARVTKDDIDVEALPSSSMARFTSAFPLGVSQNDRIHNITTAMKRINGTVVMPGQQFSLLRTLGYQLTKERGYVEAGTLQNGLHIDGLGGGVSQVSTTLYNTAFFAGVKLDAHTPHAVWIPRYPMGREATLWSPTIDNTWTNDTGHPILIKAEVKDAQTVMEFLGQKKYDVSARTSGRYDITQPKRRVVTGVAGCENTLGGGTPGFSVDVWRALKSAGKTVRTEKVHTRYAADDVIVCR